MAARLAWLQNLKATELKAVATAIGVNTGGTKPVLTAQLQDHLSKRLTFESITKHGTQTSKVAPKPGGAKTNIVSIDMGIKNLAYCRMHLDPVLLNGNSSSSPFVSEWKRINVASDKDVSEESILATKVKESFEPAVYASYACELIYHVLESLPSHILIERQRFRSMGGSSVQEWTLRVNMFESMLYSCLATLKLEGKWHGQVWAISPARVARYWIGDTDMTDVKISEEPKDGSAKKSKLSKAAKGKKAKIDLVKRWLQDGNMIRLEGQAVDTGKSYLTRQKVKGKEEAFGKLDDYADCVLQAMAWVEWEKNRRLLQTHGNEGFRQLQHCT